jgi:hypothetical protein
MVWLMSWNFKVSLRSSREPHPTCSLTSTDGDLPTNSEMAALSACDASKTRERCQSHLPFHLTHRDNRLCYEILTLSAVPLKLGLANSWLGKFLVRQFQFQVR